MNIMLGFEDFGCALAAKQRLVYNIHRTKTLIYLMIKFTLINLIKPQVIQSLFYWQHVLYWAARRRSVPGSVYEFLPQTFCSAGGYTSRGCFIKQLKIYKLKSKIFDGFDAQLIPVRDTQIFIRKSGFGYPVLLLHGFPQTHIMWRDIAPVLAKHFTVICADLTGYGQSGCPRSDKLHSRYCKRAIANDMVTLMKQLGFGRFIVAGHDRGGRVAYRMALDHPGTITRLAVLDIIPGLEVWNRINIEVMLALWPWSFMSQPAPLPEQLVICSAGTIIDHALSKWGSSFSDFDPLARRAYRKMLKDYAHVHAICEEFRAAATLDINHDQLDRDAGVKIKCPVLVNWSAKGGLSRWYQQQGGPLGIWKLWSDNITGGPVKGGHFFPEEFPVETAARLEAFLLLKL